MGKDGGREGEGGRAGEGYGWWGRLFEVRFRHWEMERGVVEKGIGRGGKGAARGDIAKDGELGREREGGSAKAKIVEIG